MDTKKHIILIGAGFGGLSFIKKIDRTKYDITVLDRNNYHSFCPLFYQVASGSLEPASICFPLRREFKASEFERCRFNLGEAQTIDVKNQTVKTQFETLHYDILVIAAGTKNNFFGIEGLKEHVFTLKSTAEAIKCRNELLLKLERASIEKDPIKRKRLLTFAVVGGGPTGVEIAGAIGELKRFVIKREYPTISPDEIKVILIEGSDRLLRTMTQSSSDDAIRDLNKLCVDVCLGKTMKSYDPSGIITLDNGDIIEADTLIWTAGVTAESFQFLGTEINPGPGGRIMVDQYNRVIDHDNIYAIGDIAYHANDTWPHGCPQLAQVAIQQGQLIAKNLNHPQNIKPFEYNDKGSMATIGRNHAVVDLGKFHFAGWFAWITWMLVHLMSLLGMRNKTVVLLNWTWQYFTFSSSLRLMLRPSKNPQTYE